MVTHPFPSYAGVIAINENGTFEFLKQAEQLEAKSLSDDNKFKLLRLAALKAWGMSHTPSLEDEDDRHNMP